MTLKWRASGAALGQNSIGDWARSLHSSDRCAYSIMHAGVSPDADRRLNCLRSCTPRQAWSEDISLFNPPKSFLTAARVLLKKAAALALILMAQKPKNPTKGSAAKLPTLPAPFEGNVLNRPKCKRSFKFLKLSRLRRIKTYDLIAPATFRRLTTPIGGLRSLAAMDGGLRNVFDLTWSSRRGFAGETQRLDPSSF